MTKKWGKYALLALTVSAMSLTPHQPVRAEMSPMRVKVIPLSPSFQVGQLSSAIRRGKLCPQTGLTTRSKSGVELVCVRINGKRRWEIKSEYPGLPQQLWMRAFPPIRRAGLLSFEKSPFQFEVRQWPGSTDRAEAAVAYFAGQAASSVATQVSSGATVLVLIFGDGGYTGGERKLFPEPQSVRWLEDELITEGCPVSSSSLNEMVNKYLGWVTFCGARHLIVAARSCAIGGAIVERDIPPGCLLHEVGHVIHNAITPRSAARPWWFNEAFAVVTSQRLMDLYDGYGGEFRGGLLWKARDELNQTIKQLGRQPSSLNTADIHDILLRHLDSSLSPTSSPYSTYAYLAVIGLIAEFGEASLYDWMRRWTIEQDSWRQAFSQQFEISFREWISDRLIPQLATDLLNDCGYRYLKFVSPSNTKNIGCPQS